MPFYSSFWSPSSTPYSHGREQGGSSHQTHQGVSYANAREDNARLHQDLKAAKTSHNAAVRRAEFAERELEKYRKQLYDLQRETFDLKDEVKKQTALVEQHQKQDSEYQYVRLKEDLAKAQKTVRGYKGTIGERDRHIEILRTERDKALARLKGRTEELRAADVYLTKADTLSDTDICTMVERLNGEIFQHAATFADAFEESYLPGSCVTPEDRSWFCDVVGTNMFTVFRDTSRELDPVLVQIALQAAMVTFVRDIVGRWTMNEDEPEGLLHLVYGGLKDKESQAVSGRWRTLARHQLRIMDEAKPDLLPGVARGIAKGMVSILHVAGIRDITQGKFMETYESQLQDIVGSTMNLRKAIGEDTVASNFALQVFSDHDSYNSENMDSAYGSQKKNPVKLERVPSVLCTTHLGLGRVEKVVGDEGEQWHRTSLLKPQVFLDTALEELYQQEGSSQR